MLNILELIKRLRFRYPLFTTTIEHLTFLEDYSIPTAATNGECVYYNPKFMMKLEPNQQLFILAHEVSHVALNHMKRLKNRDMRIWNIATDAVINAFLVRDGLTPIEGLIFIDNALEYSSEELYDELINDQKDNPNVSIKGDQEQSNQSHERWSDEQMENDESDDNASSSDNSSSNRKSDKKDGKSKEGNDKGLDDQKDEKSGSSGDKADNKKSESNDGKDKSENDSDNESNTDSNSNEPNNLDSKDSCALDEREVFDSNLKKRQENETKLKKSLNNGKEFSLGNPGFDSPNLDIKDIGKKTKLIDWRRLLKEACRFELDYSYKDAQIEDGVLVSHLIEIPSCETEILLDTSGSIDHQLLKCFLRECKNILQNSRIKVACFDDKVYNFITIRTENDLEKMKFKGGGGTNFTAASQGFTNRVDNKIIFTDGYGYVKNPPLDIIWVVFETSKNLPKEAKVIKIDRKKLIKLNS